MEPCLTHWRVFEFNAYVHIPKDERSKLYAEAPKKNFVGNSLNTKAYSLFCPETSTFHRATNLKFYENRFGFGTTARKNNNGCVDKNPFPSCSYVVDIRVTEPISSALISSDKEADSLYDSVEISSNESTHIHDKSDDDINNDVPHDEPTRSVQQSISSVVAISSYEKTFMRSIGEMHSKWIPKPSMKLREQTSAFHIAADDGDPQNL